MVQPGIQVDYPIHPFRKQVLRFLVTGISAVSTDLLVYSIFLHVYPPSISKFISFLAGSFVAYILNKFWTFNIKSYSYSELIKFVVLYSSSLCLNVGINALLLLYISSFKPLAFLVATAASTILNFVGQKWWVFKA